MFREDFRIPDPLGSWERQVVKEDIIKKNDTKVDKQHKNLLYYVKKLFNKRKQYDTETNSPPHNSSI